VPQPLRTGGNFSLVALTDTPQPSDPLRLSRVRPSVLVEASSGGAGDGAEGRFPCVSGHQPARRGVAGNTAPSGL
jgi:hypothetical protein